MTEERTAVPQCGVNIVGIGVDTQIVVESEADLEIVVAQIRKAVGLPAHRSEQPATPVERRKTSGWCKLHKTAMSYCSCDRRYRMTGNGVEINAPRKPDPRASLSVTLPPRQWDSEMAHAGYERAMQSDIQWVAADCAACGAIYEAMVRNYIERHDPPDAPCVDCGAAVTCKPGCPSRLPSEREG